MVLVPAGKALQRRGTGPGQDRGGRRAGERARIWCPTLCLKNSGNPQVRAREHGKEAGAQGARFASTLREKAAPAQDSPKGDRPRTFTGRTDAEAGTPVKVLAA